jgi:hypothetical protein
MSALPDDDLRIVPAAVVERIDQAGDNLLFRILTFQNDLILEVTSTNSRRGSSGR